MTTKRIALIAHDNKKKELLEWVTANREKMEQHQFYATGTTGKLIQENLNLNVVRLQSGPLGGDQQIGALIAEGKIDMLIFFWDPLEPLSHDPDIKALLRIAVVWNIPLACNLATADFLFGAVTLADYRRTMPDYEDYKNRKLP